MVFSVTCTYCGRQQEVTDKAASITRSKVCYWIGCGREFDFGQLVPCRAGVSELRDTWLAQCTRCGWRGTLHTDQADAEAEAEAHNASAAD